MKEKDFLFWLWLLWPALVIFPLAVWYSYRIRKKSGIKINFLYLKLLNPFYGWKGILNSNKINSDKMNKVIVGVISISTLVWFFSPYLFGLK